MNTETLSLSLLVGNVVDGSHFAGHNLVGLVHDRKGRLTWRRRRNGANRKGNEGLAVAVVAEVEVVFLGGSQ